MDKKRNFLFQVLIRSVILFGLVNISCGLTSWLPVLSNVTVYNSIVPGRERFPFGETPALSYNLSTNNLDLMFSSHAINAQKAPMSSYRVIVLGDSSVWGTLQEPEQSFSAQLEKALQEADVPTNKNVEVFNLGYPTHSALKDLLILQYAKRYKPDLILWFITLDSLADANQLNSPIIEGNEDLVRDLITKYHLSVDIVEEEGASQIIENSLISKRRDVAEWMKLQLYGVMWAATKIDQYYPRVYSLAERDVDPNTSYLSYPDQLKQEMLSIDVLEAGLTLADDAPIIFINEPILITDGENSDIRYNVNYPRHFYDQYRQILIDLSSQKDWNYLDLWDVIQPEEFTNTAFHITPSAVTTLVHKIVDPVASVVSNREFVSYDPEASGLQSLPEIEIDPSPYPTQSPTEDVDEDPLTTTPTPLQNIPLVEHNHLPSLECKNPDEWQYMPVIPDYVSTEMIDVYKQGIKAGNHPDVLSIIGDCQSVPKVFLGPYEDKGKYNLGDFTQLQPLIDNFSGSWAEPGMARLGGLSVAGVLTPSKANRTICEKGETPLSCELRLRQPSIVLVSLEEWWGDRPVSVYEGYLRQVIDTIIKSGAVPILSTKADNLEGGHEINQTIVKVACEYQIPLWNFYSALQPLTSQGLWTDGFHLTVGNFDFSDPTSLDRGRTIRNLTALQSIDFVWRVLTNMPLPSANK